MTHLSRQELAALGKEGWVEWLTNGLRTFTRDDARAKLKAFLPLTLDPDGHNPAGELVSQIDELMAKRIGLPASASALALGHWSLTFDGWRSAVLGIQVATRLGAPGLSDIVRRLVADGADLPEEAGRGLAWAAIQAAKERYSIAEAVQLASLLGRKHLTAPFLAAELAVVLCGEDFANGPRIIAEAFPDVVREPNNGEHIRAVARSLRLSLDEEWLHSLLAPDQEDGEDAARFRSELKEEIFPTVPNDLVIVSYPAMTSRAASLEDNALRYRGAVNSEFSRERVRQEKLRMQAQ